LKSFVFYSVFLATAAFGQGVKRIRCADCRRAATSIRTRKVYLTFSAGENILFYPPSHGQLDLSFPYLVTTKTGTTQQTFTRRATNLFTKPAAAFGLDYQLGSKNHFFDFEFGYGNSMDYFSLGYGFKAKGLERMEARFNVKPSLNIGYYEFRNPIGAIDNKGKVINVFDAQADSTFTTRVTIHSPYRTYNADYINVGYLQQDFVFNPKIAFEYHPLKSLSFIELSVSYLYPFYEIGSIEMLQTDGGYAHYGVGDFSLDSSNLSTTFNSKPVTTTPFTFSGLQIGLRIGF
jgi:hypothetical protein